MKFDLNYLKEFIFQFTFTAQLIVNFSDFKIFLYINMQFHFLKFLPCMYGANFSKYLYFKKHAVLFTPVRKFTVGQAPSIFFETIILSRSYRRNCDFFSKISHRIFLSRELIWLFVMQPCVNFWTFLVWI